MANTFTQIYLQFVFAVPDRISLIRSDGMMNSTNSLQDWTSLRITDSLTI